MVHVWGGYKCDSNGHIQINLPSLRSGYTYTDYGIIVMNSNTSYNIGNLIMYEAHINNNIATLYYCTGTGDTKLNCTIYAGFLFLALKAEL